MASRYIATHLRKTQAHTQYFRRKYCNFHHMNQNNLGNMACLMRRTIRCYLLLARVHGTSRDKAHCTCQRRRKCSRSRYRWPCPDARQLAFVFNPRNSFSSAWKEKTTHFECHLLAHDEGLFAFYDVIGVAGDCLDMVRAPRLRWDSVTLSRRLSYFSGFVSLPLDASSPALLCCLFWCKFLFFSFIQPSPLITASDSGTSFIRILVNWQLPTTDGRSTISVSTTSLSTLLLENGHS